MPKKEPLYPHVPKGRNKEVSQVKVIETGDRDWFKPGIHLRNPSAQKIEDAKEDAINKGFDTVYVHRVAETVPESESQKRVLVALTRNELDILEGVVREELGLITEGELKEIILKATGGKSSWEGGLTPLLTVLIPR